jgi:hypothetical protein
MQAVECIYQASRLVNLGVSNKIIIPSVGEMVNFTRIGIEGISSIMDSYDIFVRGSFGLLADVKDFSNELEEFRKKHQGQSVPSNILGVFTERLANYQSLDRSSAITRDLKAQARAAAAGTFETKFETPSFHYSGAALPEGFGRTPDDDNVSHKTSGTTARKVAKMSDLKYLKAVAGVEQLRGDTAIKVAIGGQNYSLSYKDVERAIYNPVVVLAQKALAVKDAVGVVIPSIPALYHAFRMGKSTYAIAYGADDKVIKVFDLQALGRGAPVGFDGGEEEIPNQGLRGDDAASDNGLDSDGDGHE